ncbi:hypothetical protein FNL55_16100 [Tardiphaga sp. vice352]|uniref:hypothetical protein n=1 Tax=Tardiphaga sp. vice352 TaxID=2592816 RepID=UPI001161DFF6|nr:hypothetical protein [Tardiphaga sp. vice352]QDM32702.1 hypothetical protein FNL55_16100 [Tardiphaga sp. vice352]
MTVRSTDYDSNIKHFEVQAPFDNADDDCDLTPIDETADGVLRDLDRDNNWLPLYDELTAVPASRNYAEIVKSVKIRPLVSVYRDAAFMRDLQGLLVLRDAGTLAVSSVSRLHLLTSPLDSTIFDRSSKHPPWWLWLNGGQPHPKPMRQFRSPAKWRDVSDTLHVHYLHLGLKALGPVHGFTLRLRG